MKKMYLVKREVMATSIQMAMRAPGKIYEIAVAAPGDQPTGPAGTLGFKKKKKKDEPHKPKRR